jgi:hypothetical protein
MGMGGTVAVGGGVRVGVSLGRGVSVGGAMVGTRVGGTGSSPESQAVKPNSKISAINSKRRIEPSFLT